MEKALFLFFEGLATNVIDSQVLLHCKNMKKIGVNFEIWVFACNDELYKNSLKRVEYAKELSQCEVKVFKGVRPAYPFSEKLNARLVKLNIKKYNTKYNIIHSRTDYSSHIASLVTDKFIWDCRGDTISEFEKSYQKSKNIVGKIYKRYKISNSIKNAKKAKKAIFVSNFLKEKLEYKNKSFIIGCAADDKLFFYDYNLRKSKREELQISKNDKVLIYSGGMAHYQMFPQTVEFFKQLSDDWKFLVLTNETNIAKKYLNDLPDDRYILSSVTFQEVNSYLNAADVGIMLREVDDLNRAASPTKYAEYCMSGLSIIYSDEIGDLDIYNNHIKNKISKQDLINKKIDINNRINIANNSTRLLSKNSFIDIYKRLYEV
jgi:hypothetical protein